MVDDISESVIGSAGTYQTVEIWEGNKLLDTVIARDGRWQYTREGLSEGSHEFVAVAGKIGSNPWKFEVKKLIVDVSLMTLDGYTAIANGMSLTGLDTPRNAEVRNPSAGLAPYTYTSNNTRVASVDSTGKVRGLANGSAMITINDAAGNSASFPVSVSNIYVLRVSYGPYNGVQARQWIENNFGISSYTIISELVVSMRKRYKLPLTISGAHCWLGHYDQRPGVRERLFFYHGTIGSVHLADYDNANITAAWAFVPAGK